MTNFVYTAHLLSKRFSPDWTTMDQDYSTPEVRLMSTVPHVEKTGGQIDGTGVYLFGPNGTVGLEFGPVVALRLTWAGGVTDLLWIDAHVYSGDQVIGFDGFYIELGGAALPSFASAEAFSDFLNTAATSEPRNGLFRQGREFLWAEARSLVSIEGDSGNDLLAGAAGDDMIRGYAGADTLQGNNGNDTLRGGGFNDKLWGGGGDDLLYGDGGKDRLFGGPGADRLLGGAGNDTLDGGAGNDRLTGGTGADTFVFGAGYGRDRVQDMNVAEGDRIRLDDALWGGGLGVMEVLSTYGTFGDGSVVLKFAGGHWLTILEGAEDGLVGLHGAIDIF